MTGVQTCALPISRLRPIINNDKINPLDVHERQLCQILCAYRIFLPFAGIVVSSRESAEFRNGIVKIAATKVSAGVSTGIGDHESKYEGKEGHEGEGDEQFEISDSRNLESMYSDISEEGLQPVLNDYPPEPAGSAPRPAARPGPGYPEWIWHQPPHLWNECSRRTRSAGPPEISFLRAGHGCPECCRPG